MPDDWQAHLARHHDLCARYGKPKPFSTTSGLRLLGVTHISSDDAVVFLYPTREAAEAFAASNLENSGYPSLGVMEYDGQWLGGVDLRSWRAQVKSG